MQKRQDTREGCGTTAKGRVKRYFGGSVGVVATVIRQAWWGRGEGRIGRVGICKLQVKEIRAKVFWYAGTKTGDVWVGGLSRA